VPRLKGGPIESTTIAVVVTDASLTKAQAKHLAVMAQDGLARAIYPIHTPLDGDTVFAAATCVGPQVDLAGLTAIGTAAANALARACARAVFEAATDGRGPIFVPAYRTLWGG
jgi:L-aminopeptidase/D-esterase-like protein